MGRQNSEPLHLEEAKSTLNQSQKVTLFTPNYIRKHFKTAPISFECHSRLNRNLTRKDDTSGDEEIMAMQNLLNIIYEVSIINLKKIQAPSDEVKQIIHHYLPLRIDGNFGVKSEISVQRFQKFLKLPQDGVVSDTLW